MTAKKCVALLLLAVCLVLNCGCRNKDTFPKTPTYQQSQGLDDTQKEIYNKVLSAVSDMQTGLIPLGNYNKQDVQLVCRAVLSDRPDMFWLPESYIVTATDSQTVCVGFEYKKNKYLISKEEKELKVNRLNDAIAQINAGITDDMSDFEKELYYHDWLCKNVDYAQSIDDDMIYTAFGALVNNTAVCEGYARAMQLLCATQNIDCHLVYGSARIPNGDYIGHMWNQVKIGGKYYNLDVTLNDDKGDYTYFNLTDKQLEGSHAFDRDYSLLTDAERESGNVSFNFSLPACTAQKYNYYSVFPKD